MRFRLILALALAALLALALLGVVLSTGRRLAATRRRLRPAHGLAFPVFRLTERSI